MNKLHSNVDFVVEIKLCTVPGQS